MNQLVSQQQQTNLQQQPQGNAPQKTVNCPGKRVQDYVFTKELGRGAYGQVYQARNVKTQQIVAIKCILRSRLSEHNGIVGQLVNSEVEVLQQIDNEHVVKLLCYLESQNQCYIVLEYCNSGDFEQLWTKKEKKIPESEAIGYMKQVLAGMQALHEKNVLHRDLKLANILIHNETLKIADLGFCKQLSFKDQQETLSLGSLGNMAPEVVEQKNYGMAADMFSIGSMFYQILYGSFPFTNSNSKAFLQDIRNNKPDFRKNGVTISYELQQLIEKMLLKDPNQRLKWSELYSHPLMQQKKDRLAALSLNQMQADQIDTNKFRQFYTNQDANQIQHDEMTYFNQRQNQQNIVKPLHIQEVETYIEQANDQQINMLAYQAEKSIQDEKDANFILDKYLKLKDPIIYLGRTLLEMTNLFHLTKSKDYLRITQFPIFMISKKILNMNETLLNKLLQKENIFNTQHLEYIYKHKYFQQFQSQLCDDNEYLTVVARTNLEPITSNLQEFQKSINQEWQPELKLEYTKKSEQIFREVLQDYCLKLQDSFRDFQKQDLKISEKVCELQIHIVDCICYDQQQKQGNQINVDQAFIELNNMPLRQKEQILQDKFARVWA